ncbi:MAG: heme exporter protein B [Lysobacteraceae bacterium]|nr:MAG: heme exporter protein B [Xanthomonadaceae bacterium]
MRAGSAQVLMAMIWRDLRLAMRRRGQLAHPLLFLTLITVLFPLALGPDPKQLGAIAVGIIWVGALVAVTMTLSDLYRSDRDDGWLEQLMVSGHPMVLVAIGRSFSHWLTTGLPLLLLTPLFASFLNMPEQLLSTLLLSLLLGTPTLSLIGNIVAALTVGIGRSGFLVGLLVLPLYVPVLLFAAGAVNAQAGGLSPDAHLLMLAAIATLAATLTPWATAAALRTSLSSN